MTLEELLNKLIEKGWKPFGLQYRIQVEYYWYDDISFYKIVPTIWWGEAERTRTRRTLRDVVSADSWLWQFVCENKMTIVKHPNEWKYPRDKLEREEYREWNKTQWYYWEFDRDTDWYNWDKAEYWIIESALCDDDKLEQILLDNIKI